MVSVTDPTSPAALPSRADAWAREAVDSPETTRQAQMGRIFGYLKGIHAAHLMDIGVKLGLFDHLARQTTGMNPETLAEAAGLHAPYVRSWCETSCALDLLDYDPAAGYRLAPFMDELLGQPDATYYLGRFPDAHFQVARDYARYPELFRTGGVFPYQQHDEAFFRSIAEGLQTLPRMFLDAVLPKLPDLAARLEAGARILDLGCGGGYAIVEFAARYPQVHCVGIDVEATSVGLATELIRQRGLADRVEARVVDGAQWPEAFAGAFDLVTTFLVLHEIEPRLKDAVLAQCASALRPGGQLLIFDERYPSGPGELRDPAQLFAVVAQWYEVTWGNVVNTREEIHGLLERQGLRVADETSLSRFYIVTAEKPTTDASV